MAFERVAFSYLGGPHAACETLTQRQNFFPYEIKQFWRHLFPQKPRTHDKAFLVWTETDLPSETRTRSPTNFMHFFMSLAKCL